MDAPHRRLEGNFLGRKPLLILGVHLNGRHTTLRVNTFPSKTIAIVSKQLRGAFLRVQRSIDNDPYLESIP